MAPLLPPKQTSAAEPTRAEGHHGTRWDTEMSWGNREHCPEPQCPFPLSCLQLGLYHPWHFGFSSAGSSTKGCRGGDAQPPSGLVEQKCRIPTQIQTPGGRGVRGNTGSLKRAKEGEKPTQERDPGATAPPEQGTHLHPLIGAPSLGSTGYTES